MQVKNKFNSSKNAHEELVKGSGDGSENKQMHLLHKSEDLSLIPRNPLIKEMWTEGGHLTSIVWLWHMSNHIYTHTTHTHENKIYKIIYEGLILSYHRGDRGYWNNEDIFLKRSPKAPVSQSL